MSTPARIGALIDSSAPSAIGLRLPEKLSFEQWLAIGEQLQIAHRSILWWIGDFLAYGEKRFGEEYAQAVENLGHSTETIRVAKWVSERVDPKRRRAGLSWSHHREVASLDPDEQARLLDAAEVESWSSRQLHDEVQSSKRPKVTAETPPQAPQEPADEDSAESGSFCGAHDAEKRAYGRDSAVETRAGPPEAWALMDEFFRLFINQAGDRRQEFARAYGSIQVVENDVDGD